MIQELTRRHDSPGILISGTHMEQWAVNRHYQPIKGEF